MRSSGPCITVATPLELTRWTSCSGTGSIQSTSPESSAATRVASFAIVVKIASSTLCSTLPHQFGFFLKTVFTPA